MKKLSRHAPLVLAVLWMGVAWYYWRTSVLLPAECVFQFPKGQRFGGLAPNGDVILITNVPEGSRPDGHQYLGPIDLWRMPEMRKVREVFTAEDVIEWPRPDALGRIVLIRNGKVWLADFNTGELLEELPGIETTRSSRKLFNDRVITASDDTVSIYDVKSKRVLASHAGREWMVQIDGALWALHASWPSERNAYQKQKEMTVVDIVTGQVDHRFDPVGPFWTVIPSPDGKAVVMSAENTFVVCEVSSGKKLWSMPKVDSSGLRFERDSMVLAADVLDEWKRVRTARWRVEDGTVIDPLPVPTLGKPDATFSSDTDEMGRYAIDHKSVKRGPFAYQFSQAVHQIRRRIGAKTSSSPLDWQRSGVVRDLAAEEVIGVYTDEPWDKLIAPDGSGFVSFSTDDYQNNRLRYFRLPPRRDWAWLVRWGVLPTAMLVAVQAWLWIFKRQKRAVAGGVPSPP